MLLCARKIVRAGWHLKIRYDGYGLLADAGDAPHSGV